MNRHDLAGIGRLVGIHYQLSNQRAPLAVRRALGTLRDAVHEGARLPGKQCPRRRACATGERLLVEQRDDGNVRGRGAVAAAAAGRKREHELAHEIACAARFTGMKARECEAGRGGAARGQDRHAAWLARIDGDERSFEERDLQVVARELMIQVPREAVVGDEHVRFATQAPTQRRMRASPAAGAGQSLRQ